MLEELSFRLPMPPSINGAYLNVPGRGRVAAKPLRTWKAAAGASVQLALASIDQRPVFGGRVDVALRVPIPANGRNRDGDNCLKATLDMLVSTGVIADDNWRRVRASSVEWVDDDLGGDCLVTVLQIAQEPATRAKAPRRASAEVRKETAVTRQRRAPEALSPQDAGLCAEDATVPRTATKRPSLVSVQPGTVPAAQRAHSKRKKPTSSKAAAASSDAVVRNAIASRLGIDPGRVHLTGGFCGQSDKVR